jgi:hypothetical protein
MAWYVTLAPQLVQAVMLGARPSPCSIHSTYHLRGRLVRDIFTVRLALDNITDELILEHGSGFYRAGFGAMASLEVRVEPARNGE